jgi:hypothetical protein
MSFNLLQGALKFRLFVICFIDFAVSAFARNSLELEIFVKRIIVIVDSYEITCLKVDRIIITCREF